MELEGFYADPDPARPDMEPGTAVVIVNMDYKQGPAEWEHWLYLEDGKWKVYADLDPVFLDSPGPPANLSHFGAGWI